MELCGSTSTTGSIANIYFWYGKLSTPLSLSPLDSEFKETLIKVEKQRDTALLQSATARTNFNEKLAVLVAGSLALLGTFAVTLYNKPLSSAGANQLTFKALALGALCLAAGKGSELSQAQQRLRQMVLNSVRSPHSRRNYGKPWTICLGLSLAGRSPGHSSRNGAPAWSPLSLHHQCPAIGSPKAGCGSRSQRDVRGREAANLTGIPNSRQRGTRLGNWLTREQAKELLAVTDRSTLKGKRDYVILAMLVGCALRRQELASLSIDTIQIREGRWVLADLEGKGRRIRTVAVPIWIKQAVDAWTVAAEIEAGPLLRAVTEGGKVKGSLRDWAVWSVVEQSAKQIGIERFGAHDLRRTCAKLCRTVGGDLEQIKFLLGQFSIQTTERYLGSEQEIAIAVNDSIGL